METHRLRAVVASRRRFRAGSVWCVCVWWPVVLDEVQATRANGRCATTREAALRQLEVFWNDAAARRADEVAKRIKKHEAELAVISKKLPDVVDRQRLVKFHALWGMGRPWVLGIPRFVTAILTTRSLKATTGCRLLCRPSSQRHCTA